MARATRLPQPFFVVIRLREQAESPKLRVEGGVIYGVKVLGRRSPNTHGMQGAGGTEYTPDAMRSALPLYEGAKVMTNHPPREKPNRERTTDEPFGVLRNCRVEEDDIRADLHYLESHEQAGNVVEDIKRGLGLYGLSHNAMGRGEVKNGVYVVERILEVRSVDLVTDPATNTNLWESRTVAKKKTKLKAFLEGLEPRFDQARRARVKKLLEGSDYGGDTAMEVDDPEPADPEEALSSGFEAAILSVFRGDGDAAAKAKEIAKLVKTHGGLVDGADSEEAAETEESEEDEEQKDLKGKTQESKDTKRRLAELERKDQARELCESLDFTPTKEQLAALVEIASPASRKTAAEAFKVQRAPAEKPGRTRPRSAPPGGGDAVNTLEGKIPEDQKELANWLRG